MPPEPPVAAADDPGGHAPTVAERFAFYQRAGGTLTPVLATTQIGAHDIEAVL